MGLIFNEKNGSRSFERVGRWNVVDYTIITRKSTFAKYADSQSGDKLWLTYFVPRGVMTPMKRFADLDAPIVLEDNIKLVKKDTEGDLFMETNSDNTKVRLYTEVKTQ